MDSGLYAFSTTCPICEEVFDVIKVKSTASKLEVVDDDFCMHYDGINPLLYEPWVCEHCGYAAFSGHFETVSNPSIITLQKVCLMKFTDDPDKNPFELTDFHKQLYVYLDMKSSEGERDNLIALEAFKILISNLEIQHAPSSLKARAFIRMGWLYRFMKNPKEMEYLKQAAISYAEAFTQEAFPIGKLDSATCAFIIGELNRRIGNLKESIEWFGRVLALPPQEETAKIVEKARDQMHTIKESPEYANLK